MADKVHCIRKTLRLMPEEAKMLAKKACDNGMNEAEYIRLLISQKPNDYPEVRKILKELINEVNRIGININQIVFNNNAGLYSKEDKTQLIAYMRKLNQKVKKQIPEDSEYVKALISQMDEVVAKINYQNERYDALNKKLSEIETSKDDEEVRGRLVKENQDKDALINSQQNELNKARFLLVQRTSVEQVSMCRHTL